MIAPVTVRGLSGWESSRMRRFGRIPPKLRDMSIRRASGRAWKAMEVSDEVAADALGMDRRNAARRRSGETGSFAGVCVEVHKLASAGISTYALTAHLKAIAMQVELAGVSTEDLLERLDELQVQETEANGALDEKQMRYALKAAVCPQEFRDRAARQAAVSEEIVAILDELEARQK